MRHLDTGVRSSRQNLLSQNRHETPCELLDNSSNQLASAARMERSKIRVGIDAAQCPLVWDVINNSGHAVGGRTDKHHREHKEQKGLVGDGLSPFCVGPFSL